MQHECLVRVYRNQVTLEKLAYKALPSRRELPAWPAALPEGVCGDVGEEIGVSLPAPRQFGGLVLVETDMSADRANRADWDGKSDRLRCQPTRVASGLFSYRRIDDGTIEVMLEPAGEWGWASAWPKRARFVVARLRAGSWVKIRLNARIDGRHQRMFVHRDCLVGSLGLCRVRWGSPSAMGVREMPPHEVVDLRSPLLERSSS